MYNGSSTNEVQTVGGSMKKLVLVAVCCMCMVSIAFADETKKMKCFSSMDGFY